MAIVGHWSTLAEAQKLVQSKLLAGIVQEVYEEGQLLQMLPVFAIVSKSIIYNRETTPPSAAFYDIHEQIPWTADVTQSQITVELKRVARQSILDQFMMDTYRDPNDYRTVILSQLAKGCLRTLEDKFIFGDIDNDAAEFDGIGHLFVTDAYEADDWGATAAHDAQIFDEGTGTLQILHLRQLIDVVRPRPDILLMSRTMRNTLSAAAFEVGIGSNAGSVISMAKNEFGARVDYFDGVRIVISDYMLNEDDHTGDKDSGNDSGIGSIFAIRFGQIMDGGLCLCVGGDTGGPTFFRVKELEALEDFDAAGMRLTAYCSLALGSSKALGRITSITETTAVTA